MKEETSYLLFESGLAAHFFPCSEWYNKVLLPINYIGSVIGSSTIMKNNLIALLLSIVLAAGSVVTAPAFAAETTAEEAVAVKEEKSLEEESLEEKSLEEEAPEEIEDADSGLTSDEESEEETIQTEAEEPAEEVIEEEQEADKSTEVQEESADIAVPEETADAEEAEDPAEEGVTSVEVTEIEEPAVIEEETISAEENESAQAGSVIDSGKCGNSAVWSLTGSSENFILTISGSGNMNNYDMQDFSDQTTAPWNTYRNVVKQVIIEEGITGIGSYAFYEFRRMAKRLFSWKRNTLS